MPAFNTSMSSRVSFATKVRTADCTEGREVRSHGMNVIGGHGVEDVEG